MPSAFQWTLRYPSAAFTSMNVSPGTAASAAGKSIECNDSAGAKTCILYGLNNTPLSAGVMARIQVTLSPSIASPAVAVSLSDAVAADASGSGLGAIATTGATLQVLSVPSTSVTITTNPPGLGITVDGTAYVAPQSFPWSPGSTHTLGVPSPQGAGGTRYLFGNWSDGGAQLHTVTAPASPTTLTANFQTLYFLSTQPSPSQAGTIQVSPVSSDGYYADGSLVQLRATAASGYQFSAWSGAATGATNPLPLLIDAPKSVTAGYTPAPCSYTLSRTSFSAPVEGDLGSIDIDTTDGCSWTAVSNSSWIPITSGVAGSGKGSVRFTISPNPTGALRTGILFLAAQAVVIGQAGTSCLPGVAVSAPPTIRAEGGPQTVTISGPEACEWFASAEPGWVRLPATTGRSNVPSAITAAENETVAPRTGSVSINGVTTRLLQQGVIRMPPFSDVPLTYAFADQIALLRLQGVTSGCTAAAFCPDSPTTRQEMAALIVRAVEGGDSFSYPTTPYFADVPETHRYFKYIQKLRQLAITTGCTATQYCPEDNITRGQMAALLIRARFGQQTPQSLPHPAAGYFRDVPATHVFFPYIQKIRQLGITSGCTEADFCPEAPTTRGQMAVFLIRTFFTP